MTTPNSKPAPWTPTAGARAYDRVLEKNVDVVRVYGSTATIQTWGTSPLDDGKRVTYRGVRLDRLSAPEVR